MPRIRFSLLSIFVLITVVAVGLLFYQRHKARQAAEKQFVELINAAHPRPGDLKRVEQLVSRYPVLAQRKSALWWAVFHGDARLCQHFLDAGADPNDTDKFSISCVEWAVNQRKPAVVSLLLSAGANKVDVTTLPWGSNTSNTLLHVAVAFCGDEICKALIEHGYDVNAINGTGERPIHVAVRARNAGAIMCLLDHGAQPLPDRHGRTPLDYAYTYRTKFLTNTTWQTEIAQIISILEQYDRANSREDRSEVAR